MEEERIRDRNDYEASEGGYECRPEELMAPDPEMDPDEEPVSSGKDSDDADTRGKRLETKTGDDLMSKERDEFDDIDAFDDEMEEEETRPQKKADKKLKKAAPANGTKSKKRILIFAGVGLILLAGLGYVAYEMFAAFAAPEPQLTYQRPKPKPQALQQGSNAAAKSAAAVVPGAAPAAKPAVPSALPVASQPTPIPAASVAPAAVPSGNDLLRTLDGRTPAPAAPVTQSSPALEKNVEELGRIIDELGRMLPLMERFIQQAEAAPAAAPVSSDPGLKKALADMTGEMQILAKEKKRLQDELKSSRSTIEDLKKELASLKKGKSEKKKEKPRAERSSTKSSPALIEGWEILGFSGQRVVIATEKGTQSINLGGTHNGVKILSIDVEGGTVKTSAGTLRYGN